MAALFLKFIKDSNELLPARRMQVPGPMMQDPQQLRFQVITGFPEGLGEPGKKSTI